MKIKILLVMLLMSLSSMVFAIETTLIAEKVVTNVKGGEVREDAKSAMPGDIIEYTFVIENKDEDAKFKLKPSIPIPQNMVLMSSSVEDEEEFKVTVDGINYVKYPVYGIDGKKVDDSAYKGVQWEIAELKRNEKTLVKLRARINK